MSFEIPKKRQGMIETKAGELVVLNVNIIPMDVDGIFENKNVHVKNGRIIKIEVSTHDNRAKLSRIVRTIDGANKYLVPAFFDAHTHLGYKTSEEDSRIPNLWLRLFELV